MGGDCYSRRTLELSCILAVATMVLHSFISGLSVSKTLSSTVSVEEKMDVPRSTTPPQLSRENRSHYESKTSKAFVNYWLESDKPYTMKYGGYTSCSAGYLRVELSKPFPDILNVATYLQTNLKIITVGDSVGMQFHEVLEEALEPPPMESGNQTYHTLYHDAWPGHQLVSVSAPVNGGGAIACLRMTGYLMEEGRGKKPPNNAPDRSHFYGGWLPEHVQEILDHNYSVPLTRDIDNGEETTTTITNQTVQATKGIGDFDVMIYRIPHGWIPIEKVTRDWILKSVLFARELLGVRTIILPTLFLINNIKTMEELDDLRNKRMMMRELVEESWTNPDIPNLLQLDFGGWTDQLNELNAKLLGMDVDTDGNYTLERLKCRKKFNPSIAMICAKMPMPSCKCIMNMISRDGIHWCMESIGGRYVGGISCLLQCSLMMDDIDQAAEETIPGSKQQLIGKCQQRCNDQFMSLRPASLLDTRMAP